MALQCLRVEVNQRLVLPAGALHAEQLNARMVDAQTNGLQRAVGTLQSTHMELGVVLIRNQAPIDRGR